MADKVTIPYEREAMHDMDMPKRLTDSMDKMCYLALVNLYKLFKAGAITKGAAAAQKQEMAHILDDYHRMKSLQDGIESWATNAMTKCEQAITRYNHWRLDNPDDQSGDTAELVEMLDGIKYSLHPENPK